MLLQGPNTNGAAALLAAGEIELLRDILPYTFTNIGVAIDVAVAVAIAAAAARHPALHLHQPIVSCLYVKCVHRVEPASERKCVRVSVIERECMYVCTMCDLSAQPSSSILPLRGEARSSVSSALPLTNAALDQLDRRCLSPSP
jgi:hypothetical protein